MATKRNYEMTNELLLESAKQAFLANGFKDTKLRDVCRQANLTTGAFYKHFKSKDDLLEQLVDPLLEDLKNVYLNQINDAIETMNKDNVKDVLLHQILNMDAIIHGVYQNEDIAELLLFKTNGSKYNNLAEIITKFFAENVLKTIIAMQEKGIITDNFVIDKRQIHFFVYSNTATFYDILKHSFAESETVKLYQKLCQFNYYGWINFLGL
ncbi:TetR/AcrR family transcriptional regulator [Fructilactobacillus sp. Tb1]|uniref:TetR/AcrR family transcriptional regulator n=1 Tax=Fructilactobacillus sp. Tb1 TaxID=3422304 RepID=UPI003D2765C0